MSEDECESECELRMSAMRSVRKEGVGKFAPMGGNERGKIFFCEISHSPHLLVCVIFPLTSSPPILYLKRYDTKVYLS